MSTNTCLCDLQSYLDSITAHNNESIAPTINIEITNYPNLENLQNVLEVSNLNHKPQVLNLDTISSEKETEKADIYTQQGRLNKPKKNIFSRLKNFLTRRKVGGRTNISTSMTNYNKTKKKPYVSTIIHNKPKKNKIPIIPTKKKHVYPYTKLSKKLKNYNKL